MPKRPNINYSVVLRDLRAPAPKNREEAVKKFLFNLRVLAYCEISDDHEELERLLSEWIEDLGLEDSQEIARAWEAAVRNIRQQRNL